MTPLQCGWLGSRGLNLSYDDAGANDAISWSESFTAKWSDIYRGGNLSWEAVTEEQKPVVDTAEADWVNKGRFLFEMPHLKSLKLSVFAQVIQRLGELAPAALLGEEQFFLAWGLHKPHLPFVFPQRFLDYYPEVNLPRCSVSETNI